jgi:hypothetical protein
MSVIRIQRIFRIVKGNECVNRLQIESVVQNLTLYPLKICGEKRVVIFFFAIEGNGTVTELAILSY